MLTPLADYSTEGIYGDGFDSSITISVDRTDSSREFYYSSGTLNSSIVWTPAGRVIYFNGVFTNNGIIRANGTAGTDAVVDASGGGAAADGIGYSFVGNARGGNGYGGAGDVAPPTVGGNGYMESVTGGAGGPGGDLGNGFQTSGDIGGTALANRIRHLSFHPMVALRTFIGGGSGGGGGGAGDCASDFVTFGGGGGGGGSGGSCVIVIARVLSGTGSVECIGGNGGAGGSGNDSGNPLLPTGGGGGGGGGSGGVTLIITDTPYSKCPWTFNVSGGTGGAKGVGKQGGPDGTAGSNGGAGRVIYIHRPTLQITLA
jgi:hypothetical protein